MKIGIQLYAGAIVAQVPVLTPKDLVAHGLLLYPFALGQVDKSLGTMVGLGQRALPQSQQQTRLFGRQFIALPQSKLPLNYASCAWKRLVEQRDCLLELRLRRPGRVDVEAALHLVFQ